MDKNDKYLLKNYSISKDLRQQNKSNDYLELMISNITLEDLIALKLELASKAFGIPMYGMPIYHSLLPTVKDAVCKYAISITGNYSKASKFLGISSKKLRRYLLIRNKL